MSGLGPDGGIPERGEPTGDIASTGQSSSVASGDGPRAASLWPAFRDRYTRARERRYLTKLGDWVVEGQDFACPLPWFPWNQP